MSQPEENRWEKGHARSGDVRLAKYFPDESFELEP